MRRRARLLRLDLELVDERSRHLVVLVVDTLDTAETDALAFSVAVQAAKVCLVEGVAAAARWVYLVIVLLVLVVVRDGELTLEDRVLLFLVLPLQVPDSDLLSVGSPGSLNLYDILDEIPSYLLFSCAALLLFAALPLPGGLLVR